MSNVTRKDTKRGTRKDIRSDIKSDAAYKVEILTATTAGLAEFLIEVKRVKARHANPPAQFDEKMRAAFEKLKKKVPGRKKSISYNDAIDRVVAHWDNTVKEREAAHHVARHRAMELAMKKAMARSILPDEANAVVDLLDSNTNASPAAAAEAEAKAETHIHSLKHYIGDLNRDINEHRVEEYRQTMRRGDWWFTPDPVVVTDAGDIINGQHRLLAAEGQFGPGCGADDEDTSALAPRFVVVWGVDKRAALLMDEARRSGTDRRDIALRFAEASGAA